MSTTPNDTLEIYQYSYSIHGSHRKIIDYVNRDKKVLDVGCNKGYLSREFKKNNCYTVGIEADLESALIAKQFCDDVIIQDVEQIRDLAYPDDYFDVVVLADILEHLKNPDKVLLCLRKYLNPKGDIIVSLPNIARIDIRLKLLFGKFEYEETGIMDKTHLRFFTLQTAKKLLENSGYKISSIDYTGLYSKFKIFPTLTAFQFIIMARKNEK